MRSLFLALALIAPSVQALPAECRAEVLFGLPKTQKVSAVTLCRPGYVNIYDPGARIPVVVSYVLRPENAVGCEKRESYRVDEETISATAKDYSKSIHDVGHMANAADLAYSRETAVAAALYTNMSPQDPAFNRGIWKKLEDGVRGWAISRQHPLQIYAATVYGPPGGRSGDVVIPSSLVKIVVDTVTSEVMIFMIKNEGSQKSLTSFMTSLAEAQKSTGVVFPLPKNATLTGMWPVELKSARAAKAEHCGR